MVHRLESHHADHLDPSPPSRHAGVCLWLRSRNCTAAADPAMACVTPAAVNPDVTQLKNQKQKKELPKMYSLLIHKATRKPFVAASDMDLSAAKAQAEKLYDASKLFAEHGTLASGVCVVVVPTDALTDTFSNLDIRAHGVHQCGSY